MVNHFKFITKNHCLKEKTDFKIEFDDLKKISNIVDKSIKETEVLLRKEIEKLEIQSMTKLDNLENWFEDKNKVMIALSGGVDSALVAYAAFQKLGSSAIAVTADYKTLSAEELDTAKQDLL